MTGCLPEGSEPRGKKIRCLEARRTGWNADQEGLTPRETQLRGARNATENKVGLPGNSQTECEETCGSRETQERPVKSPAWLQLRARNTGVHFIRKNRALFLELHAAQNFFQLPQDSYFIRRLGGGVRPRAALRSRLRGHHQSKPVATVTRKARVIALPDIRAHGFGLQFRSVEY